MKTAALLLALAAPVLAQSLHTPAWFIQARGLLEAGRPDEARATIERHLAEAPDDASAHYLLGLVHERRGDGVAARTAYEAALGHDPTLAEAHDRLGFLLGQAGRTEDAITRFREATASSVPCASMS